MDYDFEKAGLYPAAWAAFKANLLTMIGLAVGLVFVEFIGQKLDMVAITWLMPILLEISAAFLIHQIIISGKIKPWYTMAEKDGTSGAFTARSISFLIVFVVVGVFAGAIPFLMGYRDQAAEQIGIMLIIYIGFPIYAIFLALFGTLLPATVAQTDRSLSTAFKRGRGQFWYIMGRLIVGATLFTIASGAFWYFLSYLGVSVDVYNVNNVLDPIGALLSIPQQIMIHFTTALAATTLCKAYLRYEQRPEQTPDAVKNL